jgi:nicotinamidase-related amidase
VRKPQAFQPSTLTITSAGGVRILKNSSFIVLEPGARGRSVVTYLTPEENDYFVLKPKHSAFFQTNLEILLNHLGTRTLIFAGMATDICVLFSANDAYMRDFEIMIPSDCVASEESESNRQALMLMERVLKAKVMASTELDFKDTKIIFSRFSAKSRSDQLQ